MSAQSHLFGAAGRTDDDQVLAELEVDYTPVAVAVQLLLTLRGYLAPHVRILDPAAGSGAWARAARAVLPEYNVHITGVEPRASERANLEAACDEAYSMDFATFLTTDEARRGRKFDLIVTNPPFNAFADFWPGLVLKTNILAPGGMLALYGLSQWGQSAEASANLRRWSPSWQLRLGGRPAHRPDGKTDSREYSLWGWDIEDLHLTRRAHRPRWTCEQLPELPLEMRRWPPSAVPGTYPIEPALVDEIRRRYL